MSIGIRVVILAGAALGPVAVTVEDADGVPVAGVSDTVTVALAGGSGGAALAGGATAVAVSGVASFGGLWVANAGSYTLVATAPGYASAASALFTVSPGAAAKLAFVTQPSSVQGQVAFSPAVQVAIEDTLGNAVTSATGSVSLALGANPDGAALGGTTTVAAAQGIASFPSLSVNDPGNAYTLVASWGTLPPDTSARFAVQVTFASLSAGHDYACGVATSGPAYCWGGNAYGELGTGTTSNHAAPVAVAGGLVLASVSGGFRTTCGVTRGGQAYCWGSNAEGQLGNGTTAADTALPVPVAGGLTFSAVSVGGAHACGVIASSGAAYCWGYNANGQLGNGTTVNSATPVPVSGGLSFSSVSAGDSHTCGVTTAGVGYCWGLNSYGQLGDGTTGQRLTPAAVAVPGGATFVMISSGALHACGVAAGGMGFCWGDNQYGQLGNATDPYDSLPQLVQTPYTFTAIASGQLHSCGLSANGTSYCWGYNVSGQLGDGTTTTSSTPVAVLSAPGFASLTASGLFSCGLTAAGAAYCWGYNGTGQLGDGTFASGALPVPVIQ